MSKPSPLAAQKPSATPLTTKSAWARGPPQPANPSPISGPTPSFRGPSPNGTPGSTPSHSRKSSAFSPAVAVKDGVSIPRVAPSHRASPSLNFGSIDANASPTLSNATPAVLTPPVNGSSSTTPPTNPAPARTFGTLAAGSSPLASATSSSQSVPTTSASPTPSNVSTATSSTPAPVRRKLDPHKMFQNQPSQPTPVPSSSASSGNPPPSNTAFPSQAQANVVPGVISANLPTMSSPSQRLQPLPPPATHNPYYSPQQQNQQIPAQHLRPTNGGPRSPSFSRNMQLNGSNQGPNGIPANGVPVSGRGPHGGPQQQQPPPQMGSPRLGQPTMMSHQQSQQQAQPPPPVPQPGQIPGQSPYPPPQMAPGWQQPPYGWPQYQQYPPYMVPQDQWYPPHMQHPHMNHPHHHPQSAQYLQTPSTPHQAFPAQSLPPQSQGQPQQAPPPNPGMSPSPRVPIQALPLPHQSTGPSVAPPLPPPPPSINTNLPPTSGQGSGLRTAAREFIPSNSPGFPLPTKKTAIRITTVSGDPVVFRPPDGHSRTLSREVLDPAKKGPPVRMESEEDKKKRIAEEEAKIRKAQEEADAKEAEKKRKIEEERLKKEEEEKEAKRKVEEAERLKREEEERVKREAEEERLRKEEEERQRIEDEARRQKEEEDRLKREEEQRIQNEKEEEERRLQEAADKAKADEEARQKEAEEARLRAEREDAEAKERMEKEKVAALTRTPSSTSVVSSPKFTPASLPSKPHLPPITTTGRPGRPVPGPLDLSSAQRAGVTPSLPSALASARKIDDLDSIRYPEGIKTPDVELNEGATKGGKYKYDRDFLLQFMALCKDKPDNLPPLNDIGIERDQDGNGPAFNMGGRPQRRGTGSMGPPSSTRSASVGLGFVAFPGKGGNPFAAGMGQFQTPAKTSSEDRFRAASASIITGRVTPMSRSNSQGGVGGHAMGGGPNAVPPSPRESNRIRAPRGRQRNESLKPNGQTSQQEMQLPGSSIITLEPVAPLQATENRWAPSSLGRKGQVDETAPEHVERKVKALLNKLTLEKFDSISDQIVAWANKSEKETDGRTLIHVIKLVFEKATDEAPFSEMYARLCRKMMETLSSNVQDESIKNSEGKPIVGGHLFRKYLLNRCQEDFERGWSAKESADAAAALKAADDKAAEAAASGAADGEVAQFSEEYYAALKLKRQGLGLVKFIGELFKLQMLTERIMHECIKKLLSKIDNPEEEEIESLCKLLTTVGQSLDTPKAKNHMDIYFQRMDTLSKNPNVVSRVRYMLLDVIELRSRNWQPRQNTAAPQTIAQIHEQAAKEKADASRLSMSRGGSQRGAYNRGGDHVQTGPDGWNVAGPTPVRAPAKAGDLTHFGKFNTKASSSMMMTMGPSSVFKKGERGRETPPPNPVSRTASSSNMFSMLAGGGEAPSEPIVTHRTTSQRGSSRKASVDLNNSQQQGDAVPGTPQRKKLQLLPRTIAATTDEKDTEDARSETGTEIEAVPEVPMMTETQAKAKVDEDVKEFFGIRDLAEGTASFEALPEEHKSKLVDKLISRAMDSKEDDVKLVAELFSTVAGKACSPAAFEAGFAPIVEFLDDMAIDVPQAYLFMACLLHGSKLPQEVVEALAAKIYVEGDPEVTPKDKLLKAYANRA